MTAVSDLVPAFLNSLRNAVVGFMAGTLPVMIMLRGLFWWLNGRELRRWRREDTLRQQIWELEDQIWLESLPDWQREAVERGRQQRAEIKREARRRLELPEEEPRR
jgi:hypothetical protein